MQIHPGNRRERPVAVRSEMDEPIPRSRSNTRNNYRASLTIAILIAVIFFIVMVIYIIRQDSNLKATISKMDSEEEKETGNEHEKIIYDNCIDILWENLLSKNFDRNNPEHLQPIRIKVFITLRRLSRTYKRDLILFLYEHGLIRTDSPFKQLDLHDADLKDIRFENINLDYLYLPGVIATNSRFTNCQLKNANFRDSVMDKSHFTDCSLEKAIFSGTSLKNSTFKNRNILPGIDFTNADLFGSQISIDWHNSENIIMNTRLPNGSFASIDSNELINDGGAEQQCNGLQKSHWSKESEYPLLKIAHKKDNSCTEMESNPDDNCYFQANITSQMTQNIDLTRYSSLIDNNQSWYKVSAYSGCSNSTVNDSITVELRFANKREFYEHKQIHIINNEQWWMNSSKTSSIPMGTRKVNITIGIHIQNSVEHHSVCCAIDDIRFHIFNKNEKN